MVPSKRSVLALSLANALGYLPSTCMPVWVGQIGAALHWPGWAGGALASLQLGSLTVGNLIGPSILVARSPRAWATAAASVAAAGFLLASTRTPLCVVGGCAISGLACGFLLAIANSLAAGFRHAQHTFAVLQVSLVAIGIALLFTLPKLLANYGVGSVFLTLCVCALAITPLMRALPESTPAVAAERLPGTEPHRVKTRALVILFALAVALASQTALMACILEAGARIGVGPARMGTLLAAAATLCLGFPLAARLVGERGGLTLPLVCGTFTLALAAAALMRADYVVLFVLLLTGVMGLPLFMLPYVLAMLARFGDGGVWAAVGPGFMMAGVAIGPAVAAAVHSKLPLSFLGVSMGWTIAAAGAAFMLAAPRPKSSPTR